MQRRCVTAAILGLAAPAFVLLALATAWLSPLPGEAAATFAVQRASWLDGAFSIANRAGDADAVAAVLMTLVAALAMHRRWSEALLAAGAGAWQETQALTRTLVHRPEAPSGSIDGRVVPGGDGFPSGHAFGELLVYGLVFWFAPRLVPWRPAVLVMRAACVAAIALGGPARLYVGAHWPADVAGAWALAAMYLVMAVRMDAAATAVRHAGGWRRRGTIRVAPARQAARAASPGAG